MATLRWQQTGNNTRSGRLAGTGLTDNGNCSATWHPDINIAKYLYSLAVGGIDAFNCQHDVFIRRLRLLQ